MVEAQLRIKLNEDFVEQSCSKGQITVRQYDLKDLRQRPSSMYPPCYVTAQQRPVQGMSQVSLTQQRASTHTRTVCNLGVVTRDHGVPETRVVIRELPALQQTIGMCTKEMESILQRLSTTEDIGTIVRLGRSLLLLGCSKHATWRDSP